MDRLELDVELDYGSFRLAVRESLDLDGITAVFGSSGSGKTSLLRVIAGLEPSARGLIRFRDTAWLERGRHSPPEARAIGYVFQDGRLFAHLDVRGNLLFPLKHGRRSGAIAFDDIVAVLGLEPLLLRYPASLSGGESQRVAIGRALLANPSLLLMDEPLSSLDRPRKRELLPLIRSLPARFGLPVLYVTHDLDELAYLADEVILLAAGRNVARGSAREIVERNDFAGLAELDDPGTILEAKVTAQTESLTVAALGSGELRVPRAAARPGETIRLRVDPRDVILAIEAPAGISIRNSLKATVIGVEQRSDGLVAVRLTVGGQELRARITRDAVDELALHEGREVFALIKTVALDALG